MAKVWNIWNKANIMKIIPTWLKRLYLGRLALGHVGIIIIIYINISSSSSSSCRAATRISLTLTRRFSLTFIASGRSSGLHPVSSNSCCMYVRACRPAFARPYEGVHRSTSLMSSSLLLQHCPACLVRLTWIVFVMGGRWLYSWCLVRCCRQDLFNIYIYIYGRVKKNDTICE